MAIGLESPAIEIGTADVLRNAPTAILYEHAIAQRRRPSFPAAPWRPIPARRPAAARSTSESSTTRKHGRDLVGSVNIPVSDSSFLACRQQALDTSCSRPMVYVVDGFAGWDPDYRIKVRLVCARAYHALFMHNLLIRPTTRSSTNSASPTS